MIFGVPGVIISGNGYSKLGKCNLIRVQNEVGLLHQVNDL